MWKLCTRTKLKRLNLHRNSQNILICGVHLYLPLTSCCGRVDVINCPTVRVGFILLCVGASVNIELHFRSSSALIFDTGFEWQSRNTFHSHLLLVNSPPLRGASRQNLIVTFFLQSRDSSVGMALGYGLDDRGPRVRFPAGTGNFSLQHRVQNGSGAHPASCPLGTRGSFPGGKAAGAWSWPHLHLVPRSRMRGAILPLPQYAFMAWCWLKAQGQLYLTLPLLSLLHQDRICRYELLGCRVLWSPCFKWAPRHEGVLGSGGIAPRILDSGTRWRWVVSFTPRPLCTQGKCPWYPLDWRWVGPRAGLDTVVKRKFPAPAGTRTPQLSNPYLSAIPLSYPVDK
jgi:hypothetical protein